MALTVEQKRAIQLNEGNILVSASAGSGKTFVMIERVARLLLEGKANVDELLCVTFTVLAAKEMKQKLAKKLTDELKNGGDKQLIERQLDLLPISNISTIHSFCNRLLTEYFYEVGLDPAFKILDDKESEILANRAIDRLFEDLYEKNDSNLNTLLPYFFKYRSDKYLKSTIMDLYFSFISEASPFDILKNNEFYYSKEGVDKIYAYYLSYFKNQAQGILNEIEKIEERVSDYQKLYEYICVLRGHLNKIIKCTSADELAVFTKADLPRKPNKPKTDDPFAIEVDNEVKAVKELIDALYKEKESKVFVNSYQTEVKWAEEMLPVYKALCALIEEFSLRFEKEKREENGVDYSDLEHLTLKLLQNEQIRSEIKGRFKYIFTDEYQDTSGVQESILTAIASDNLFMVGDPKQSIYDFRGCNPGIFSKKFALYEKGLGGTAISLDKNFRSTKTVIASVNNLFKEIMTIDCGKVDYAKYPMVAQAEYPEDEGECKMLLTLKSKAENAFPQGVYSVVKHLKLLGENKCFEEGRQIAELISKIYGTSYYCIKEKRWKSVDYGDIVILLRSANADCDKYAQELIRAGIPVSANSKRSIAEYAEIALAVNILQLIDCYNQDIALAAVLKSPIGNLTDSDFMQIRRAYAKGTFVEITEKYALEYDDEISKKLHAFKKYFDDIRLIAEFIPCDELLAKIVRDKGIDISLLSSRMGKVKLARLNRFIQAAGAKKQTASEFLQGIDKTLQSITVSFADQNAVKIMSIHASKGLEFSIVIMGGINKKFINADYSGEIISDRSFGIALSHKDLESRRVNKNIFLRYASRINKNKMLEGEMNLLYVAMTRAKNNLYLIGEFASEKSMQLKPNHLFNDVYGASGFFAMFAQSDMPCEICSSEQNKGFVEQEVRQVIVSKPDPELVSLIKNNLQFEYGYQNQVNLSVKRSVTSAAHYDEQEGITYEKSAIYGESDSDIGNAYHRFLELCDFSRDAESEFNRLIGGLLLTEDEVKLIEKQKIERIFALSIFKELNGFTLYKEQPFTCYMPARIVEGDNKEGEILVQGIIDLLAIKGNEAIIIDYKHSKIKDDQMLIKRYQKQLELYAYAVQKVLDKRVIGAYLVNLYSAKVIKTQLNNV